MNKPQDHGFLRIVSLLGDDQAVSDYTQTKQKFKECRDSDEAKSATEDVAKVSEWLRVVNKESQ